MRTKRRQIKSHLKIGERFKSLPYKGHKIEVARNQEGYILIIDGIDISYGFVSVAETEKTANEVIDCERSDSKIDFDLLARSLRKK